MEVAKSATLLKQQPVNWEQASGFARARAYAQESGQPGFTAPEITVIAPCFNEAVNIFPLVQRTLATFDRHGLNGEIVLVDDCSTDATLATIRELAEREPRLRYAHHAANKGLFAGWLTGLSLARGHNVCLIDADLQNPPEEIYRLYRCLQRDSVDMVQGVRSSIGRLKDDRYLLSRGLNICLNTLFGMKAADNKSGFVIAPRDVMRDVLNLRRRYHYPHTFIRVAAERKSYIVAEVETLFVERQSGQSFLGNFPIRPVLKVMKDLAAAVLDFSLRAPENDLEAFLREHAPLREPEAYTGWRKLLVEAYFHTMPLHKWMITRRARGLFHALRRSQYLSREDMDTYRLRKLRRLLRHAYNHVPYYRDAFDKAGVKVEDIQSIADLARLPLLAKADVRDNLYFGLFADNHNKKDMHKVTTSGSTGEPFTTYADRHQLEWRFATTLRAAEWTGWRFGDRQARLWHQTLGMSWTQVLRERIDALFMRRLFIPAYEIKDGNIRDFLRKLRKHRPVLVDGYAESFNFLAHYAHSQGLEGFQPKAVMSSAQIMPDQVRTTIEDSLQTRVFDKYGSREFSGIAYEDEGHDGHLVMAESYIVEILKDGRPALPGETGEVVITDLNNFHVPIIRYRIGDLAVAMDDQCGRDAPRQFPRLGRIEGRSQAIILCSNGAWLPGTFFAHFFKDHDQVIRHYQVVQDMRGAITIKIVPGMHFSEEALGAIIRDLRHFTGQDMRIDTEVVESIPLVRTGKRTSVVSRLDLDFQTISAAREA